MHLLLQPLGRVAPPGNTFSRRASFAFCGSLAMPAAAGFYGLCASDATGHDKGDEIGHKLSDADALDRFWASGEVTRSTKLLQSSTAAAVARTRPSLIPIKSLHSESIFAARLD